MLDAGKQVSLISGRDTALKGAQVSADKITATVGRDLTLQSLQDTDNYKSKQTDVSGGVSFAIIGSGASANLSISKSKIDSKYQSVQEQTGLFGGKGGYQIDVGNHTQLDGSVIASTATPDKNRLNTGTLGWSVLKNKADYTSQLQSASVSSGSDGTNAFISNMPTGSLVGFNHGDSDSGTTSSAISNGTLNIRDPAKQQQDVATLSHDVEHANGAISPIFDKEKEQKRLRQVQLIADIGTQAADITRTQGAINAANAQKDPEAIAAARDKLIREGNTQPTDKEIAAQVTRTVMQPYETGGDYQRAAQAVTAALQGLAGRDIGSALAGASAPYLANIIKQSAQDNDTARIMAHVVLGAVVAQAQGNSAVAGAAGAGTGELIAAQLYPGIKTENLSEKQKQTVSALSTLASGLAGGLAGGDLSGALAGAKAGNNAVENNSVADIASALAEGKTLEQKAEERINAENEHYKEQNCAGLSAEACSAQMYAERRESLAYTLAGGAVVIGTVAGGMLLGPALLNACGMNPVACTELTIAAAEVPFGAAMAGGGALGVGGFGSLGAKEVAATADAAAAARNVETVTGGALGPKGTAGASVDGAGGITVAPKTIPYEPKGSVVLQGDAPVCGPACAAMTITDKTGAAISLDNAIGSFVNGVRPTGVNTLELSDVISKAGVKNTVNTSMLPEQLNKALQEGTSVIVQVPAGQGKHFIIVDGVKSVDGVSYYMTRDPYVGPRGVQQGLLDGAMSTGVNAIVIGE
ncbi:VENN motif pre-toxin domain-containing protein [Pseudomonas orientalis]|uniref:VENN motif pre-toxin domain-containing protein n=1 Tax=Pseudomonas orientalis TaxID=76758 RepID=UPI002FE08442